MKYQLGAQNANQSTFYIDRYVLENLNKARFEFIKVRRVADDIPLSYDQTINERVKPTGEARDCAQRIRFYLVASNEKWSKGYVSEVEKEIQLIVETLVYGRDLGREELSKRRKDSVKQLDRYA